MTAAREYPVIFSAPMIRAILEGRKTQTRRLPTSFAHLWNSLHRKPGTTWEDSPEVWRIEFRRAP